MSDSDCCTTLEKIKVLLGEHKKLLGEPENEKIIKKNKEQNDIINKPYKDDYTNSLMRVNRHSGPYDQNQVRWGSGNRKSKKSKKSKKGKRSRKARKSRRKSNRRRGRR